jgi:hypothetical protein
MYFIILYNSNKIIIIQHMLLFMKIYEKKDENNKVLKEKILLVKMKIFSTLNP